MERRPTMTEWLAERFVPGFSRAEPKPPIGRRAFRAYGYSAARVVRGKFVEEPMPGVCKSHERAVIALGDAAFHVLLHREIPLLAFARGSPGSSSCLYDYVDAPHLAAAFGEAFVPVPKSALVTPVDLIALERAVGKDRDLGYWTPKRLGEILYNFWD